VLFWLGASETVKSEICGEDKINVWKNERPYYLEIVFRDKFPSFTHPLFMCSGMVNFC